MSLWFEVTLAALLCVIAASLIAILYQQIVGGRAALLDPSKTPDYMYRERLTSRLQELIAPLEGFQMELESSNQAIEQLSVVVATLQRNVSDLTSTVERLKHHVAETTQAVAALEQQATRSPCQSCPMRESHA